MIVLIIIGVLIGLAYADYCLVDSTEHFGISYQKVLDSNRESAAGLGDRVDVAPALNDEVDVVVPPSVGIARLAGQVARNPNGSPRRRPGSGRRDSGPYPAHPSIDAGVAAIGN